MDVRVREMLPPGAPQDALRSKYAPDPPTTDNHRRSPDGRSARGMESNDFPAWRTISTRRPTARLTCRQFIESAATEDPAVRGIPGEKPSPRSWPTEALGPRDDPFCAPFSRPFFTATPRAGSRWPRQNNMMGGMRGEEGGWIR